MVCLVRANVYMCLNQWVRVNVYMCPNQWVRVNVYMCPNQWGEAFPVHDHDADVNQITNGSLQGSCHAYTLIVDIHIRLHARHAHIPPIWSNLTHIRTMSVATIEAITILTVW